MRAYEVDLLGEVDRKELGARKLVVGSDVPRATRLARARTRRGRAAAVSRDADLPVLDVLVGQLLAFHRCLEEGLRPDTPSTEGVINRVVESFAIHRRS